VIDPTQNFFGALGAHVASAFETVTGERPQIAVRAAAGVPKNTALLQHVFSGLPGAIWIAASEADSNAAGALALRAAGVAEADPEKLRTEFLEVINQTIAGVVREMTERLGRGIQREKTIDGDGAPADVAWASIEVAQGSARATLLAGVEPALLGALAAAGAYAIEKARELPPSFDLLLDVELPISVSFGRTQVPLKDVLKLTTGSIVELNRAIGDPVEVIVNNCVIARGEVVTVEGNFGVRIHEVVSRNERWKTLG